MCVWVFKDTFNYRYILSIKLRILWRSLSLVEKTRVPEENNVIDLPQVTDKLDQLVSIEYTSPCVKSNSQALIGKEPGQTKDYDIDICSTNCCFSAKHAALRKIAKTGWLGIRIMCPSGATYLTVGCCFSELVL